MHKMEENQGAQVLQAIANVLLGGVVALFICLGLLLGCSVGISGGWLSEGLMYQLAVACCVVSSCCGALIAVRRCKVRALIVGLLTGAAFFLILLTVGVLFFRGVSLELGGAGLLCGALCGGAAAGIVGAKPSKKRRKK